ncbi:MAG: hypothetical protein H9W81_02575 [Enterococcus sp.]|nr:hypothetical protein [Enterococcus sp.]
MTTIRQAYLNAQPKQETPSVNDIRLHPSPLIFPVGVDVSYPDEQVTWNTNKDQHLFVYGSVVDGLDRLLHNLAKQGVNHERHWSLYSANSFGAGKHAAGLTETAWHKSVNLNLYLLMMTELWKIYHERVKKIQSYHLESFGDLRRITGMNELLIILPDLVDIIADDREEVKSIVDIASTIATNGHEVGMHGVFVFDRMGDHSLYSEVLDNASSVVLRNMSDITVFGNMATLIPYEKGYGMFKTKDNGERSFFHTV